MRSLLPILLLFAAPLLAQKYAGPKPDKPDLPYLMHADTLVPTEVAEARQEQRKNDIVYVVSGAASTARTPLASPILLIRAADIHADRLQLFKMQSKGGQREVLYSHKKNLVARAYRLNVNPVDTDIYRIEVDDILENGEYALTPEGSNQVFCFQIY